MWGIVIFNLYVIIYMGKRFFYLGSDVVSL